MGGEDRSELLSGLEAGRPTQRRRDAETRAEEREAQFVVAVFGKRPPRAADSRPYRVQDEVPRFDRMPPRLRVRSLPSSSADVRTARELYALSTERRTGSLAKEVVEKTDGVDKIQALITAEVDEVAVRGVGQGTVAAG